MQQEYDPMPKMVHYIADIIDKPNDKDIHINAKIHAGKYNKLLNLPAIFEKLILLDEEYQNKFKENLLEIFKTMIEIRNFSSIFQRLLEFINQNQEKLQIDYQKLIDQGILEYAKRVRVDNLKYFVNTFKLNDLLGKEEYHQMYIELINKQEFDDAFYFYKEMNYDIDDFNYLISQMDNCCSKAGQFIKKLGLDPNLYKSVIKKQIKGTAYYYFKAFPWYKCEELLAGTNEILIEVCYLLEQKKQVLEAASIVYRQNLIEQCENLNFRFKINQILTNPNFVPLENIYYTRDDFIPSDKLENPNISYLTSLELGYPRENIFFIEQEGEQLDQAVSKILKNQYSGFDTEFTNAYYQLDDAKQELQIMQIAVDNYAYIFDNQKLNKSNIFKAFIIDYLKNSKIIGHTVYEDLSLTCKALNLGHQKIHNYFDISLYANKIGDGKQKSLASMTENILKKPLSKCEQRSRWAGRPLRLAQIHYAAMDAIVCLKIFYILQQQFNDIQFKNSKTAEPQQELQEQQ